MGQRVPLAGRAVVPAAMAARAHLRLVDAPQHCCVREGALKDDNQQRQRDGGQQAELDPEEERAQEGDQPDQEVTQVGLQAGSSQHGQPALAHQQLLRGSADWARRRAASGERRRTLNK